MFITIGPDNHTGFRKHLEELAHLIDSPSKLILVKEKGPESFNKIKKLNPFLTIIGGRNWIIRNNKILEKIPNKKGILFCSPLAQAEISNEEISNLNTYLNWLDKGRIDFLFTGSQDLAKILNRKDILHLPAPFISEKNSIMKKKISKKNSVSILNDKASHKNILNTIAGVANSKNVEEFVINGLPSNYANLIKRFRLERIITNTGFLSKKKYYQTIDKIKLNLHLSFSEGFCYSTLEALYRGTPTLVSNAITWFYHPSLYVKNPTDYEEISKKIDKVLDLSKSDYEKLSKKCRTIAEKVIEINNKKSLKVLRNILTL